MQIIRLSDATLEDIKTDSNRTQGCPTCGYGSILTHEVEFIFDNGKTIAIESSAYGSSRRDDCEGDLLTSGDIIEIFNVVEDFASMTFEDFCNWLADRLQKIAPHTQESCGTEMHVVTRFEKEWNF